MATRKKKETGGWPKIAQGSHLTVKTFEDGKTELTWDWDALVNEVRIATTENAGSLLTASNNWPYPD
jgi:hypothetical protein